MRGRLFEDVFDGFLVFRFHLAFGEFDVERDEEIALGVVVVVHGHAFFGLLDARAGPRDAISLHAHHMSIQMLDGDVEARQRVLQRNGDVSVEIVTSALEHLVLQLDDAEF